MLDQKTKQAIIDVYINRSAQFGRVVNGDMHLKKCGITCEVKPYKIEIKDANNTILAYCERRYSQRKINLCYPELKHIWYWADTNKRVKV